MRVLLLALAVAGCKRPPAAVPDARVEELELTPPGELKDKVNDTLQKEHERTLEPKVE